ncbi:MAG: translocation/assembly module TamB [Bacteroidales bacterium]|nr:translocation/assembly module TamB [Bacteroidales bacterium]
MGKIRKKRRIFVYPLAILFSLLLSIFIIFKSPPVQTFITHIIANKLSEKLKTNIKIGSVDFSFFKTFIFHNIYIEDQMGDTLLFIRRLNIDIDNFSLSKKQIAIKELNLNQPTIKIKQFNDSLSNFQFILDAISDTTSTTDSGTFTIFAQKIRIILANFQYHHIQLPYSNNDEIDFNHINIHKANIQLDSIRFFGDSIGFNINHLALKESSGFKINHLSARGKFNSHGLYLNQLIIHTPQSLLQTQHFHLKVSTLNDFDNFVENVRFDVIFKASKLHSNDLAYFSKFLKPINQHIYFSGRVKGPISSLKVREFIIKHAEQTFIKGNYDIEGLIVSNNPYLSLRLSHLETNPAIYNNITLPTGNLHLPEQIIHLGKILYKGELSGFINDFVVFGKCYTNFGNFKSDISLKYDTVRKKTMLNGYLALYNFAIGKMLNQYPLLQNVSLEINTNAEFIENRIKGNAKGTIHTVDFNQYTYKNIIIDGAFTEKLFDGNLQLNDPNIKLDFLGKIDYSQNIPVFNFMADIKKARLNKINLIHPDSNITVSFLLDAKIQGTTFDELQGNLDLYQIQYEHFTTYQFPFIHLQAVKNNGQKELIIQSDILKAELKGNFQYQNIIYSLQSIIHQYLPSVSITNIPKKYVFDPNFHAQLNITFHKQSKFLDELFPTLFISNNTAMSVKFTYPDNIWAKISSDSILFQQMKFMHAEAIIKNNNNFLETNINIQNYSLNNNLILKNIQTKIISDNDKNELYISWNNNDSLFGDADISAILTLANKHVTFTFNPSRIFINQAHWYVNDGIITLSDSIVQIQQTIINEGEQYFMLNGNLGKNVSDTLKIDVSEFQMATLNPFLSNQSIMLSGKLNGTISIIRALEKPIFLTDIFIQKLQVNNEDLGDLKLVAEWNDENQLLQYRANAYRGNIHTLDIAGTFDKTQHIDATVKLDKWRLHVLEPFIQSFAKDIKGIASGTLTIKGTTKNPIVGGKLELTKTAFFIPFLNTRYNFTGEVNVQKDAFLIDGIDIYDEEVNKARISGKITHQNFTNFFIDLNLNSNRFLFMNTKYSDTSFFYGSVYASGLVNIKGTFNQIDINANVQTEKGTKFNLNLESASEITQNDFIKIINKTIPTASNFTKSNVSQSSGLSLNFNIQATPEANVQLIFDSKVGDIIKSQGSGNLRLELKPNGDFLIFGNYIIAQGDYLFTLQNVINKKFEVEPGSTVSFNGDPLSANLDIKASYKLRTSLYELMLDSTYKNRVPVSCELSMKNNLLNPSLQFNIVIPNSDSRVEGVLTSLSEEEINKQVISLLVLNRFVTPESYKSGVKSVEYSSPNAIGVNSSELLTNQLNHWLSQISKTVNLGVNYRPGDVITNEELELALNTQILNDRVTINTNLGVSNSTQNESSMLIGDFDIEAKLSKSGKLRAKGFNRTNTNILKDTSPYTQGVGIFYREEFDNWGELIKNYWKILFARKNEEN